MKKLIILIAAALSLTGCATAADVASENLSKAAEEFQVTRRVVAMNDITNTPLFVITGRCSLEYPDNRTEIVCKLKDGSLTKHVVRQGDNVTVIMEQTNGLKVSEERFTIIYNPSSLVPNIEAS